MFAQKNYNLPGIFLFVGLAEDSVVGLRLGLYTYALWTTVAV